MATPKDVEQIPLPQHCIADFCLIPIGTATASVSAEIADVQRLMARSGLEYSMHSAGTTVEGSWEEVTAIIGRAHAMLHTRGIVRVQTDIRIGTRQDKVQSMADKVDVVQRLLAADK